MGLQYYDITVAAGKSIDIPAEGSYFRYYSGNAGGADESILVKSDTNAMALLLKPGQSIRVPEKVRTWHIANYANVGTIAGIVVIGDGEIQDSQVAGTVAVIDGGRARTMAGVAFIGYGYQGPVVGNLSHVQLWNQAASGKNLIVEQVSTFTQGAGLSGFAGLGASVALTTLNGLPPSKKIGGPASAAAQIRSQANAAILGLLPSMFNMTIQGPLFKPNEPIVVPPGFGLNILNGAANQDLGAHFEFFEESI